MIFKIYRVFGLLVVLFRGSCAECVAVGTQPSPTDKEREKPQEIIAWGTSEINGADTDMAKQSAMLQCYQLLLLMSGSNFRLDSHGFELESTNRLFGLRRNDVSTDRRVRTLKVSAYFRPSNQWLELVGEKRAGQQSGYTNRISGQCYLKSLHFEISESISSNIVHKNIGFSSAQFVPATNQSNAATSPSPLKADSNAVVKSQSKSADSKADGRENTDNQVAEVVSSLKDQNASSGAKEVEDGDSDTESGSHNQKPSYQGPAIVGYAVLSKLNLVSSGREPTAEYEVCFIWSVKKE